MTAAAREKYFQYQKPYFLNGTHVCMKIIIDQQRIFAQMEAAATVASRLENLQIMEQSVFS